MTKKVDVLLIIPPMYQSGRIPDYNPKEPMGLMYIAAVLRQNGFSVKIIDAGLLCLTIKEALSKILSYSPSVIGLSILQRALPSTKLLIEMLEKQEVNAHICGGGITATLSASTILERLPRMNSIVMGEGEITFNNLVKAVISFSNWQDIKGIAFKKKGDIIFNPPTTKPDLDLLPWPVRDFLPICLEKTNYATILSSRGCYGNCTFCTNASFEKMSIGPKWRARDPTNVVDEIKYLRNSYKVKVFKFNDANIFGPGKKGQEHVINLCKEIIHHQLDDIHLMAFCRANDINSQVATLMKKAGFERILIGVESANPKILQLLRKGETLKRICYTINILQENNIDLVIGFLIFNPYTTIESLEQDIAFLEKYSFTPTLSKTLRIFDGIPLQQILEDEHKLVAKNPFEAYHEYFVTPNITRIYMALKTVYAEWIDTFKKLFQAEIWKLKKATSFNKRRVFYSLDQLIFDIEVDLLKSLIRWEKSNEFNRQDISNKITEIKSKLGKLKNLIQDHLPQSKSFSASDFTSVDKLTKEIYLILTIKKYQTFPEKYRWKED